MDRINPKKYILIPNEIIKKIDDIGGCDTFGLYINILLTKNWNDEVITTPSILLHTLSRDKQYLPNLREQLNSLAEYNVINADTDVNKIGLNDIIKISLLKISGKHTEIKCVNSNIFKLDSSVNNNILFAAYVYLTMAKDRTLNYALVSHDTISKTISVSIKTVQKAVKTLDENGYITVTQGAYNRELQKNNANKYRVHNHGDPVYNSKLGFVTIANKDNMNSESEYIIENKIAEILDDPNKFSPCLITGLAAKIFLKIYDLDSNKLILTVSNLKDISNIFSQYGSILYLPQRLFVFDFKTMNERIEKYVCEFIEQSVFPLIFLSETEFDGRQIKDKLKHIVK